MYVLLYVVCILVSGKLVGGCCVELRSKESNRSQILLYKLSCHFFNNDCGAPKQLKKKH